MSGRAKRRRDAAERFSQRYGLPLGEAARIVERNVIGADLGANGYTTVAQAKLMARHLDLGPAKLLLDIGSGRGWPALYFAEITSCRVVLSDVPHSALRKAQATAGDRGIEPFVSIVRSSGTAPPFAPGVFDAVSHTDTLWCIDSKLSVLRACRAVLKPGGRMAFFTIFIPPGLKEREYRYAIRSGPSEVSTRRRTHQDMLQAAGFSTVQETDLTGEFLQTAGAWLKNRELYQVDLLAAEGEELFNERRNDSLTQLQAIEDGLLRRSLFVCS